MSAHLVDCVLNGTIDNIRDVLAVVAAATADPSLAPDRTWPGVNILLGMVDSALAETFDPTADGPSDEAARRWHKDGEPQGNPTPPPRRSGPRARGGRA